MEPEDRPTARDGTTPTSDGALAGEDRVGRRALARTSTSGADPLDAGGPDEHGVERARRGRRRRGRPRTSRPGGRSALRRTAMSMRAEAALVGPPVEHLGGQQDHARRRCRSTGRPSAERSAERVEQARLTRAASTWWSTRRPGSRARRARRGRPACGPRRRRAPSVSQDAARARRTRPAAPARRRPAGPSHLAASPVRRHGRAHQPRSASLHVERRRSRGRAWPRRGPCSPWPGCRRSRKWVVASTMALATTGRVVALEDARADEHRLGAELHRPARRRPGWRCRRRRTAARAASPSRRSPARAASGAWSCLAQSNSSAESASAILRMSPMIERRWRTASTMLPVPASPFERIMRAPSRDAPQRLAEVGGAAHERDGEAPTCRCGGSRRPG